MSRLTKNVPRNQCVQFQYLVLFEGQWCNPDNNAIVIDSGASVVSITSNIDDSVNGVRPTQLLDLKGFNGVTKVHVQEGIVEWMLFACVYLAPQFRWSHPRAISKRALQDPIWWMLPSIFVLTEFTRNWPDISCYIAILYDCILYNTWCSIDLNELANVFFQRLFFIGIHSWFTLFFWISHIIVNFFVLLPWNMVCEFWLSILVV